MRQRRLRNGKATLAHNRSFREGGVVAEVLPHAALLEYRLP